MAVNDKDDLHPDEARIAALYRDAAAEEPPATLDAAVLRNARGALKGAGGREPRTAWWMPWRVPFAFAAVAVLSVSVVLVVEREGGEPLKLEAPSRDAAAPPAAPAPEPPASVEAPRSATTEIQQAPASRAAEPKTDARRDEAGSSDRKEAFEERRLQERARGAREEPPQAALQKKLEAPRESATLRGTAPAADAKAPGSAAPAERAPEAEASANFQAPPGRAPMAAPQAPPVPAPVVAPQPPPAASLPERRPAMAAPAQAPTSAAGPAPATKPFAAAAPAPKPAPLAAQRRSAATDALTPAVAALVAELEQRPAAEWLARIAALRREGRSADADGLAAEFKRRFPDEPLPPAER
jgi:hypothetical protein